VIAAQRSPVSWAMRWFVCIAFLSLPFTYQLAETNKTIQNMMTRTCSCVWFDEDSKIINLSSLQETNGSARFTTEPDSKDFIFSYNPCSSFSLPQTEYLQSDCYNDVAICMYPKNKASYQNIGRQNTVRCGIHNTIHTPQLNYTNEKTFPNWTAIVNLKCDPTRISRKDAKFEVINSEQNPRLFLLTHNCACPNGCLREGVTEDPHTSKPPPSWEHELTYSLIGAFATLVIVVPFLIWRFEKRQNNGNEENRQLLYEENDRVADYAANHFNDFDGTTSNKDINVRGSRYNNAASLC